jgi:hypothetical protein
VTLREIVREAERKAIVAVLRSTLGRGRLTRAAQTLGIARKTLWEKMRLYQIDKRAEQPQGAFEFSAPPTADGPHGAVPPAAPIVCSPSGEVTGGAEAVSEKRPVFVGSTNDALYGLRGAA